MIHMDFRNMRSCTCGFQSCWVHFITALPWLVSDFICHGTAVAVLVSIYCDGAIVIYLLYPAIIRCNRYYKLVFGVELLCLLYSCHYTCNNAFKTHWYELNLSCFINMKSTVTCFMLNIFSIPLFLSSSMCEMEQWTVLNMMLSKLRSYPQIQCGMYFCCRRNWFGISTFTLCILSSSAWLYYFLCTSLGDWCHMYDLLDGRCYQHIMTCCDLSNSKIQYFLHNGHDERNRDWVW